MKKLAYIFVGMALLMVGCNKETTESPSVPVNNEDELIEVSIIGSIPEDKTDEADVTKTDYDFVTDATKAIFSWSDGDQIALVVNNNGTVTNQDRYTLNIASISNDGKTATFSGLIDKHKATGEWKSTGFAVYPVSISQKNTNSSYSSQFVKLASSVDGAKSSVIMVGTPNDDKNPDNFEFKVATSVLRVTLKGIPANAKELRLATSDKVNYPVDGDFSLVNTSGIVTIGLVNYLGWGNGYQSIDLSSEGAIKSREFLFNIPVGTYPKNTLSLTLYDTDNNELLTKKVAKDFNFQRNHFISTPELTIDEWYTLGTGKFFDKFPNNDYRDATYADVLIEQNVNNLNQYRITNPYGAFATANSITSDNPDKYLILTVNPETSAVSFTEHKTGITKSDDKIKIVCSGSNNKVVTKDAEGNPQVIRLAPIYQYVSNSGNWDRTGVDTYPDMIGIIFPGYDTDISVSVSGSSYGNPAITFKAEGVNVATAKIGVAQQGNTSIALVNMNEASASTETNISGLMGDATGNYTKVICVRAYNSDGAEIALKTIEQQKLISISSTDYTKFCGEYSFGNLRYLPQYDSKSWHYIGGDNADASDLSFVITASDCPLKGNVMITKILGISYDATISDQSFIKTENSSSTLKDALYTAGAPIYGTLSGTTITFSDLYNQAFVQYNSQPVYFGPNSSETSTLTFTSSSVTEDGVTTVTLTSSSNNLCLPFNMKASGNWDTNRCLIKIQNSSGSGNVIASRTYPE